MEVITYWLAIAANIAPTDSAGRKRTIRKRDGSGTFSVDADPVGDAAPMETVETRALRRAMLKLREAMPGLHVVSSRDDSSVALAEVVEAEVTNVAVARGARPAPPGADHDRI